MCWVGFWRGSCDDLRERAGGCRDWGNAVGAVKLEVITVLRQVWLSEIRNSDIKHARI